MSATEEVIRVLGVGPMSEIALLRRGELTFVRKRLSSRGKRAPEAVAQLETERDILGRLQGEHAPRLLRGEGHSDASALAMEWIATEPTTVEENSHGHVREAYAALARIFAREDVCIVHGDIHPENLAREAGTGRVVFFDFALGRIATTREAALSSRAGDGAARGHYLHMAPEVARGDIPSHRSDVYSLASALLMSRFDIALRASDHAASVLARAGSEGPDTSALRAHPYIDDRLRSALLLALRFDAEARPTADDLCRMF